MKKYQIRTYTKSKESDNRKETINTNSFEEIEKIYSQELEEGFPAPTVWENKNNKLTRLLDY